MPTNQPSFTRSEVIALLRRAAGVVGRQRGIEYLQLAKELDSTASWMAHLGRIGPPPPGLSLEHWARLSTAEKKATIARHVDFADFNANKVHRQCRACGSTRVEIVDVDDPPSPPPSE